MTQCMNSERLAFIKFGDATFIPLSLGNHIFSSIVISAMFFVTVSSATWLQETGSIAESDEQLW